MHWCITNNNVSILPLFRSHRLYTHLRYQNSTLSLPPLRRYLRHPAAMGLGNAFRKVLHQPARNPPRRPRAGRRQNQQTQEQLVIASYRDHLNALAQSVQAKWAAFDAEPDDFHIVKQLRQLREELTKALESYHAALGARDNSDVLNVINCMEATDERLVLLDQQVMAEVERFEFASLDIASRHIAAIHPHSKSAAAGDANDVLIELDLYRDTWGSIIDIPSRSRLDHAHGVLQDIISAQPPSSSPSARFQNGIPQPAQPQPPLSYAWSQPHQLHQSYQPHQSHQLYQSHRPYQSHQPYQPYQSYQSYQPSQPQPPHAAPSLRSQRPFPVPPLPPSPPPPGIGASDGTDIPDREYGSSESGDEGPMRMVISRTRTLRDVAEGVLSISEKEAAKLRADPGLSSSRLSLSPGTSIDQPNLSSGKNMSFASTLYQTRHARVDAISDAGILLTRSSVRGDGRCMFRALARGRAVASGEPIPSEKFERGAADELRARAVAELKKHRSLLSRFFVIEGDLDQYTKKMSHARTYGGEPELLMLAKLLHVPIAVYIVKDGAYRQIQVYGKQYRGDPLRILYSDGIHYDALLASRNAWR